jgi:DNA-binding PucR family transcriptional regulator
VSLTGDFGDAELGQLLGQLGLAEVPLACSTPRRDPAALHEALREADILLELLIDPHAMLRAHEETYRLLVGVMIRNPDELTLLRSSTIAELERYDELHDTELLATLEAFLAHHGSTTETAEAMHLHRHTVGYRLARVQEVSGLSPYASEGRERLSLGLKANRIVLAARSAGERASAAPPV